MRLILLIILSLPLGLFAQSKFEGRVIDADTQEGIPFVTVYVDGSSNGTISNEEGWFILDNVYPTASVVFSHTSYITKEHVYIDTLTQAFNIELNPKKIAITTVEVKDWSNREANVKLFSQGFLGNDYFGRKCSIENDSVLFFKREIIPYEPSCNAIIIIKDKDVKDGYELQVTAREPIIVDMPVLGYTLYVDLIDYYEKKCYDSERVTSRGYHYFKSYPLDDSRKSNKIRNNRQKAFFNSQFHLCWALHNHKLNENGFAFYERVFKNGRIETEYIDITKYMVKVDEKTSAIKGLADRNFVLVYHYSRKGWPYPIGSRGKPLGKIYSKVHFYEDSCAFSESGVIPLNGMTFSGDISEKRIGASLPSDYRKYIKN